MSKKGGKAPSAPDYSGLAKQDAEEQRKTAEQITGWNRPNQTDQYGNTLTWNKDASGNWSQSVNMNPEIQAGQNSLMKNFYAGANMLSNQGAFDAPTLNSSGLQFTNVGGGGGGGGGPSFEKIDKFKNTIPQLGSFDSSQGDKVANDMFQASMNRLRPQQEHDSAAMDTQLRQQGLQPGTAAYDRAMKNLMTSQGDVNANLGLNSTAAGYDAAKGIYDTNAAGQGQNYNQLSQSWQNNLARQGQLGQQSLGAASIAAQNAATGMQGRIADQNYNLGLARQNQSEQGQQFSQALTKFGIPTERVQTLGNLLNSAPGGPSFAGFNSATGYSPANMSNAAQNSYNANMGKYNAQQGKGNSLLNAGSNLGSAYLLGK
jgi:hypothetical protein